MNNAKGTPVELPGSKQWLWKAATFALAAAVIVLYVNIKHQHRQAQPPPPKPPTLKERMDAAEVSIAVAHDKITNIIRNFDVNTTNGFAQQVARVDTIIINRLETVERRLTQLDRPTTETEERK